MGGSADHGSAGTDTANCRGPISQVSFFSSFSTSALAQQPWLQELLGGPEWGEVDCGSCTGTGFTDAQLLSGDDRNRDHGGTAT